MLEVSIRDKLTSDFSPEYLEVVNESDRHNVPPGSESHFKIILVSADLDSMSRVARHQAIYRVLRQERESGVHALAIHAYSPEEWRQKGMMAPGSPNCMGGNGR